MSETFDFKKEYKELYTASAKKPKIVAVPSLQFLVIDGKGDPDNDLFGKSAEALYSLSYNLKFTLKKAKESFDYKVAPLEGLWWVEEGEWSTDKTKWLWRLMVAQPKKVTQKLFDEAKEVVRIKKNLALLDDVRLEKFDEGKSAQIMHIGPYDDEAPTIESLHKFVESEGLSLRGKHHEIYLGDPRRTAPEKLKTILRHPVE